MLLHGPVASTATAWRVLKSVDASRLEALRTARAVARERAWLARGELTGTAVPAAHAGGRELTELVIDVDATLVEVHSDKGRRERPLQRWVRIPPAAGVPGQHQRGPGTNRPDEIRALGESQMAEQSMPGMCLVVARDRERPSRYVAIVEFPTLEVAMENNARPETDAFARRMAELCTSGPRFYNLDVEMTSQ
jgi:hypothetical protein